MGSFVFLLDMEEPLAMNVWSLANRFGKLDNLEPGRVLTCI